MNKWKVSFFTSATLLVVTNAFWLLVTIDAGVTDSYQQASLEDQQRSIELLGDLVERSGSQYSRKDVLHILRQTRKNAFIVEGPNVIDIDGVRFHFVDDRLSEVRGPLDPSIPE